MQEPMTQSDAPVPSRIRDFTLSLIHWLILIALLLQALFHFGLATQQLTSDVDTSYPESSLVERSLAILHGQPLYDDTMRWPYLAAPYGPMTYYPPAMSVRAWGLEDSPLGQARQVYLAGRAISYAAGLLILLALWILAGHLGLPRLWRFLPVLLFFSTFRILEFWYSFRPDFPMVAFVLWGWIALLRLRAPAGPMLAAVFLALASFYKHTAVLAAASLFLWLLVDRRFRDLFRFSLIYALLVGAQSILLILSTKGAWLENTVGALRSPIYFPAAYVFLTSFTPQEIIPLAGGLAALLGVRRFPTQIRPLCWVFALSFLWSELTLIRTGSNLYYYLETYCWGTVLAAACIHRAVSGRYLLAKADKAHLAWLLLVSLAVVPLVVMGFGFAKGLPGLLQLPPPLSRANPSLVQLLGRTKGEILANEGFLQFHTQSPPTCMDTILYSARVRAGGLSTQELIAKIRRKDFEYVILTWDIQERIPQYEELPFLPPDVVRTIAGNYRFLARLRQYYIYDRIP